MKTIILRCKTTINDGKTTLSAKSYEGIIAKSEEIKSKANLIIRGNKSEIVISIKIPSQTFINIEILNRWWCKKII